MRIRFKDIEFEAATLDQLRKLYGEIDQISDLWTMNQPKGGGSTISPGTSPVGVKIPGEGERLRRTQAEIDIDEERAAKGLPRLTRAEIIKLRMEQNASPAKKGGKFTEEIDLDSVPD